MKKISVAIIFLSVAFTVCLSSCMDRKTAFGNGNDKSETGNVAESISETKILDLSKTDIEKKEAITIDEIKQLVAESEELYREYDEIILLNGDKIVTDRKMCSDADIMSSSYNEYYRYLLDIRRIFLGILSRSTQPYGCWVHEEQLGLKYIMAKNLPLYTSLLYLNFDIENKENSLFKDPKYMLDYYYNETRDYDIIYMSRWTQGENTLLHMTYCPKGTGRNAEEIFPTAEQQATLNAIKAREAAEKTVK